MGEDLQQITEAQPSASSKKESSRFASRAKDKDFPSIIRPYVTESSASEAS